MQGKDMTLSADFFDRPDQFVQWINWEEEIAYIVEMSRSEYEQSAFLDHRIFEQFDKGALRLPLQDLRKLYAANVKPVSKRCYICLLYTSPSPRDQRGSRMPSSA